MTIGEKIRILCELRSVHEADLANELNISFSELKAIENGEVMPSIEQVLFLAKKFNIKMEILADPKLKIIPRPSSTNNMIDNLINKQPERNSQVSKPITEQQKYFVPPKKIKYLLLAITILTIASFVLAPIVVNLFHSNSQYADYPFAVVEYLYAALLLLPIAVLSIWAGKYFGKRKIRCKKNTILGSFLIAYLLFFVVLALVFNSSVSHDKERFNEYNQMLRLDIPSEGGFIYINKGDIGIVDRSKATPIEMHFNFTDGREIKAFEEGLPRSPLNHTGLSYKYLGLEVSTLLANCDYFALYDCDNERYITSTYVFPGERHLIAIGYDVETKTLHIVDYYISIDNYSSI